MIGNFIIGHIFSFVVFFIMKWRRSFYRKNPSKVQRADCPVISIGNISVGGTGKTPTASHFLSWLQGRGLRPGLVSEGYRGSYSRDSQVASVSLGNSKKFGDEPSMLKGFHKEVPIYLSKRRINACRELTKNHCVDVIIADDAFQHMELHRDIEIVLIDVLEPLRNYTVIPFGRARESLSALKFADYIILNKVNLSSKESVNVIYDLVRSFSAAPIVQSEYVAGELKPLFPPLPPEASVHPSANWSQRALLVSGVGNPFAFEKLAERQGIEVRGHLKYRDHHKFSASDIEKALGCLASLGAERVIVTDKDAIKIIEVMGDKGVKGLDQIWSLGLEMKFDSSWPQIREDLLERMGLKPTCR